MESLKAYIIFSLKASFDEFIGLRPELVRALRDLAEPLFSKALSYSRPSEPACSKQVFWLVPQPVSLIKECTLSTRARAQNFSHNFGWLYGSHPCNSLFQPEVSTHACFG